MTNESVTKTDKNHTFGDNSGQVKAVLSGLCQSVCSLGFAETGNFVVRDGAGQDSIGVATFFNPLLVGSLEIIDKVLLVHTFNGSCTKVLGPLGDLKVVSLRLEILQNHITTVGTLYMYSVVQVDVLAQFLLDWVRMLTVVQM